MMLKTITRRILYFMPAITAAAFALFLLGGFSRPSSAADYYLSPHGDDAATGSAAHPWQTLARLQVVHLAPGDRVLLQSGGVFPGGIVLDASEAGTLNRRIVIASTGQAPATIEAAGTDGISAAAGGLTVKNIILRGAASGDGKDCGIAFNTPDPSSGARYPGIVIDHVEITGFGGDGIVFHSQGGKLPGYDDVSITYVNIHNIYGTGISSNGDVPTHTPSYAHHRFFISDCDTSNNGSGSGIILGGVDGARVQFCRSAGNVGHGGGVGIWAYASRNATFEYCIASGTRTNNGGDGGGFDLDGGCKDCKVIHCLSYDNDGPGYMHCDYPTAPPTDGNVIARSISVNDGRKPKGDFYGFGFCNWGAGLSNDTISDNLAIVTAPDDKLRQNGVLWATFIPESADDLKGNGDVQRVTGCVLRNNTVYIAGQGIAYVNSELPHPTAANLVYQGNSFQAAPGVAPVYRAGDAKWSSRSAWSAAIAQPPAASQAARTAVPGVSGATATALRKITDPHQLPRLPLMLSLGK